MKNSVIKVFLLTVIALQLHADKTSDFKMAMELLKTACVSGEKVEIKAGAKGGISFLKKGLDGEVSLSRSELRGMVSSTNDMIKKEDNSNIRACMQPHIATILTIIATTPSSLGARNKEPAAFMPTKQWVPLDLPLSLFDGRVSLTLTRVYENARAAVANFIIDIPHRLPHKMNLTTDKHPVLKNSYKFRYRDTVYKFIADKVDLQGQKVMVSVMKYKDIN